MDSTFFSRFSDLCRARGVTPNAVARAIGVSSGSVTAWKNGAAPRNATVTKIAEYFHVTADYLLTGEDLLEQADIAFYGDYRELNEEQKQTVRDMVKVMLKRRGNQ